MRFALVGFGFCLLATPAFAYTDRVVPWHLTEAQGRHYFMPPADCLVGPLPTHKVYYLSQAEMNHRWPTGDKRNPDRYGMTFYAHSASDPFDYAVIFLPSDLPSKVRADMLKHEESHLRGCQHPGYVTHSDGTPVR
jgi:hypothetical protein